MKPLTSKQMQRIEKKQKKIAAFLEIAKLNDRDRKAKSLLHHHQQEVSSDADTSERMSTPDGPCRKRHKKEGDPPIGHLAVAENEHTVSTDSEIIMRDQGKEDLIQPPVIDESTPSGKPKVTGEEFRRLKRELRERKNRLKNQPRLRLREAGQLAAFSKPEDLRCPLFLSDIQHLLLFATFGQRSPYFPSRWCQLDKYSRLSHIIVFVVDGFSSYDFLSHESLFPGVTRIFKNRLEVISPHAYGSKLAEELISIPVLHCRREKLIKEFGSLQAASFSTDCPHKELKAIFPTKDSSREKPNGLPASDRFSRINLLLSPSQMTDDGYPMPTKGELQGRYADYVFSKDIYEEVTPSSPMFGLDCEMCKTTTGELELTRISVVNEQLEVVYETFVKPYNQITDYLTRFSGITNKLLKDVTVRLEQVQKDLKGLLPPDAILIGQSLHFDLQALKMFHPYVIDTSVIYNLTGDRYRKTKLAVLSREFLGEEIQVRVTGHCPAEDSIAAMKLTQLKLANDIEFGDVSLVTCRTSEDTNKQNIPKKPCGCAITCVFSSIQNMDKTAAVISTSQVMHKYSSFVNQNLTDTDPSCPEDCSKKAIQCIVEGTNEDIVRRTCEVALEHTFTIAHIKHSPDVISSENDTVYEKLDSWCRTIWDHMALNGMCIVLLGGKKGGANGAAFIQIKKEIESNLS